MGNPTGLECFSQTLALGCPEADGVPHGLSGGGVGAWLLWGCSHQALVTALEGPLETLRAELREEGLPAYRAPASRHLGKQPERPLQAGFWGCMLPWIFPA